jgi:hypothetical protein
MLCTQAANGDSAFHTKLRLNVCELKAHAAARCDFREPELGRNSDSPSVR